MSTFFFFEDHASGGLFHYERPGFVDKPTDYYASAIHLAADDLVGNTRTPFLSCYDNKLISEVSLDHVENVFDTFHGKKPLFVFTFTTGITHDDDTNIVSLDEYYDRFMNTMIKKGYLNDTIIVLYGDHGYRYGSFRGTYLGKAEENLPFMSFVLPLWFKTEHPNAWYNLIFNDYKLTSNYDVYLTIMEVLEGSFDLSQELETFSGYGTSLFRNVSEDRSCSEAGIPEHYCACVESEPIEPTSPEVNICIVIYV